MTGEFYEISRNNSRDYSDRYRECSILEDKEGEEILLSTREIPTIPNTNGDIYHRIKAHEITRFDILANTYYKNPLLWWVIAEANGIADPLAPVAPGSLIRIPSIEALYGNNGILL